MKEYFWNTNLKASPQELLASLDSFIAANHDSLFNDETAKLIIPFKLRFGQNIFSTLPTWKGYTEFETAVNKIMRIERDITYKVGDISPTICINYNNTAEIVFAESPLLILKVIRSELNKQISVAQRKQQPEEFKPGFVALDEAGQDLLELLKSNYEVTNVTWARRGQGGISGYERFEVRPNIDSGAATCGNAISAYGRISMADTTAKAHENLLVQAWEKVIKFEESKTVRNVTDVRGGNGIVGFAPLKFEAKDGLAQALNKLALAEPELALAK